MTIELKRARPAATAQTIQIGKHNLTADMTLAEGGAEDGPSPHDLYDAALGACKALTVLWYANKKGIPVDDIRTSISRDSSAEKSGIYRLAATLHVSGALSDDQIRELEAVAGKCPIHKLMTAITTEISTVVERLA
ncbi:MAG TPA: OsmC family protein [Burkholderiaceae bacterium]|nr:OsmC family protein [Burkholderiaceae bacterium]